MEKDINLIVEIDPGEAQKLIGLIELLFREWYVARHDRQTRLADLKKMATQKAADRKGKLTPEPDPAPEPEPESEPKNIVAGEAQGDA